MSHVHEDVTTDYQKLLREITRMIAVPQGLAPQARWQALIAIEERQREISWLVDQITYAGMAPAEALARLEGERWLMTIPSGPKLAQTG